MNAKQAMEIVRSNIDDARKKNIQSVTPEALEKLVEHIEGLAELSDAELTRQMEHYRAQNAANLTEYRARITMNTEMFRSVILAGQTALKSSTLINGGAAVALLAFIGHVWEKELSLEVAKGLTEALLYFVSGVFLSAIAAGTTYLSQWFYASGWIKTGHGILVVTILAVVGSLFLFAGGGYKAYSAFLAQLG